MPNKKDAARAAIKTGLAAKAARGASRGVGKTALRGGKAQAKLVQQAVTAGEPASIRYAKYGLFAIIGFAAGALLARVGSKQEEGGGGSGSVGPDTASPESPAGQRGETWGSGTPLGSTSGAAGGPAAPASPAPGGPVPPHQHPEDPNRTGAERDYSDPSGGPLIGRSHGTGPAGIPEQQEELEQRIRTRVGEDPRTLGLSRLNVEVNDGVAEIRGTAPSQAAKDAVGEIAASVEGIREVRNMLTMTFS
jgi:hypothetical protein